MSKAQAEAGHDTTANEVERRFRLASPVTAAVLAALVLFLFVLAVLLAADAHQLVLAGSESGNFGPGCLAFGVVGVVVAGRQPHNPMGWLLLGVAGFLLLSGDASAYVVLDYRMHTGSLPIGAVGLLLTLSWVPALMLLGLTILIFPSGQLPSRRWRWVVGIGGVAGLLYVLGASVVTVIVVSHHDVSVTSFGELTQVQQAGPLDRWWRILNGPCLVLLVVSLLAVLVHQVSAYRRSSGELRLQENWFLTGAAVTVIAAVSVVLLSNASGIWAYVHDVLPVLFAALPIGLGVGILKYRLYDIDRLISRTLSYAIVTGVVVGLYVGIITLVTRVLGFSSPIAVAASTLAAVAVFNPLRVRVQHIVDRRFNRARYDAEATIAGFTARLRGAVDLETVRSELLEVVNRAVEPAHASVWIRQHKSD